MNNFFSGHNMAMNIMGQTSLPMQMRQYQNDLLVGRDRCLEHHPERLDADYETRKPFLPKLELPSIPIIPELTMPEPLPMFGSLFGNRETSEEEKKRRIEWADIQTQCAASCYGMESRQYKEAHRRWCREALG